MGCSHLEYEMNIYQQPQDTFPHKASSFKVIDHLCHRDLADHIILLFLEYFKIHF